MVNPSYLVAPFRLDGTIFYDNPEIHYHRSANIKNSPQVTDVFSFSNVSHVNHQNSMFILKPSMNKNPPKKQAVELFKMLQLTLINLTCIGVPSTDFDTDAT